jgi:hypothetical protein
MFLTTVEQAVGSLEVLRKYVEELTEKENKSGRPKRDRKPKLLEW